MDTTQAELPVAEIEGGSAGTCLSTFVKKVQVGKDQEKTQSEKDSHSKNRGGKKTKLTIRYLYHETYRKPNEQLFSQ